MSCASCPILVLSTVRLPINCHSERCVRETTRNLLLFFVGALLAAPAPACRGRRLAEPRPKAPAFVFVAQDRAFRESAAFALNVIPKRFERGTCFCLCGCGGPPRGFRLRRSTQPELDAALPLRGSTRFVVFRMPGSPFGVHSNASAVVAQSFVPFQRPTTS